MITVELIDAPSRKAEICSAILHALPDWFGIEASIQEYIDKVQSMPLLAVMDADAPIGFAALKFHNTYTAELYVIGILAAYHRQGLGKRLLERCAVYCRELGMRFLTVKTLDASANSAPYDRTRSFYLSMSFIPLEVFPEFWDPRNPCLLLVMPL